MSSYVCSVNWEYCKGKRKKWYFYGEKSKQRKYKHGQTEEGRNKI